MLIRVSQKQARVAGRNTGIPRKTKLNVIGNDDQHESLLQRVEYLLNPEVPELKKLSGHSSEHVSTNDSVASPRLKEPALDPLFRAIHLLAADSPFWVEESEKVLAGVLRQAVHNWYVAYVEEYGWMRVPLPNARMFKMLLKQCLQEAIGKHREILKAESIRMFLNNSWAFIKEMWPVAGYVALIIAIDDSAGHRANDTRFMQDALIKWIGTGKARKPHLVMRTRRQAVYDENVRFVRRLRRLVPCSKYDSDRIDALVKEGQELARLIQAKRRREQAGSLASPILPTQTPSKGMAALYAVHAPSPKETKLERARAENPVDQLVATLEEVNEYARRRLSLPDKSEHHADLTREVPDQTLVEFDDVEYSLTDSLDYRLLMEAGILLLASATPMSEATHRVLLQSNPSASSV